MKINILSTYLTLIYTGSPIETCSLIYKRELSHAEKMKMCIVHLHITHLHNWSTAAVFFLKVLSQQWFRNEHMADENNLCVVRCAHRRAHH